ncbi:MAG: Gfo/Idh/MocA family oxidoreductase [Kiritimatiellae bacterium]|jgi:predicted dehydrogenase|nr:Gfo/Idh/MocA family oxidoreductase [Kiritimatiellia bacterium]
MAKIAVISTAHIHSKSFLKDLQELTTEKGAYVIWDENAARGMKRAEEFNSRFEPNLDVVLQDDSVEGFLICAENTRHLALMERVMPIRKPVMCEKPLATSIEDITRIVELQKQYNTPLISGYMQPFFPENRGVMEVMQKGELGKVTHINFRNAHNACYGHWFDNPELAWFTDPELSGGGALLDMGTHAVHLLCHLGGTVEKVMAMATNVSGIYPNVDDYGVITMLFSNGIIGRVEAGWVFTGGYNGLEIIGSEKSIWNGKIGAHTQELAPIQPAEAKPDRVKRLLALVAGEISAEELQADLKACIDAVAIMSAAYESAEKGTWIDIKKF